MADPEPAHVRALRRRALLQAYDDLRVISRARQRWPREASMYRTLLRAERELVERNLRLARDVPEPTDLLLRSSGPPFLGMYPC